MISVVIPVYNQADRLFLTLESLRFQAGVSMADFEVIVVNDGSSDRTEDVIRSFCGKLPLKTVTTINRGRAAARNRGLEMARGDIVIFTDADRAVCHYWISNHSILHKKKETTVGIGDIREFYFSDFASQQYKLLQAVPLNFRTVRNLSREHPYWKKIKQTFDLQNSHCLLNEKWICTLVGNLSIKKSCLNGIGGFDEEFNGWGFEHFELGYRLAQAGADFAYVSNAENYHFAHERGKGFYEQNLESSHVLFLEKHPSYAVESLIKLLKGDITIEEFDLLDNDSTRASGTKAGSIRLNIRAL